MKHPAGEDGGEGDEIGGERVEFALEYVYTFPDFEPVSGEAAEGLVHGGEEGDGTGSGGFAGLDHELGEEAGVFVGLHEGAGAGFYVEDEAVEVFG